VRNAFGGRHIARPADQAAVVAVIEGWWAVEKSHIGRDQRLTEGAGRNILFERKRGFLPYPHPAIVLSCAVVPERAAAPGFAKGMERIAMSLIA
jgi:hypothetical protein